VAGTAEYRLRLSQQRANAVRDLLVSLGAPADRIGTQGLGSDFPGYVKDRDAQGNLDPIPAAQNRQVIIEFDLPRRSRTQQTVERATAAAR
jgi:outer membrane protein OmpA-like peptidoglycan-associated protein